MRLIDADAANVDDIFCYYENNCCVVDVEEWLKDQPTVDAAPVVHGRWEFVDDYTGRCTNCREENGMDWEDEDNYCPNCGAKMDGGS